MNNRWTISQPAPTDWLNEFPELPNVVLQSLYNRGYRGQDEIEQFLQPNYSRDVLDPYLFSDMHKAVDRIFEAIANKQLITIHGDYDADGVAASVIIRNTLVELGAKVEVFLPHREKDGYGMNLQTIDYFHGNQTALIITCDCGISNFREITKANEYAIDTIITDHHQIPEQIPPAFAIIHPRIETENYPFKELAGGGVAFKLVQALLLDKRSGYNEQQREAKEKWLLDLVSISTIADMVYLIGENRTLVKYGLIVLKKNRRLGLTALLDVANLKIEKIDARAIAFQIAPRINAAGRMDHANAAYILLIEDDKEKARALAQQLDQTNSERQLKTEEMVKQARLQFIKTPDPVLFFYQENWPLGLTGLVAGQLVRSYNKPCFVLSSDGEKIVGSGRSLPGLNILKAIESFKENLIAFGGHQQACGFRLNKDKLDEFKIAVTSFLKTQTDTLDVTPEFKVDALLRLENITWEVADNLEQFSPYGMGNEQPLFQSDNVTVVSALNVGKNLTHVKLVLQQGEKTVTAIAFSQSQLDLKANDIIDIVYSIDINRWNGNKEIQLQIKDIKVINRLIG